MVRTSPCIGALKKPTIARYFALAAFLWSAPPAAGADTAASSALTEREAVRRALARAALTDTLGAYVAIEEGRARIAGSYPNPEISYLREQTFGSDGTREDMLSVAQTMDLGRRRGLRAEAGESLARAARAEGEQARLEVAADARLRFWAVLHRQARVASLEAWLARIDEALGIVAKREASGDAATYDRRRLERERAIARARVQTEHAALEGARARLAATLDARALPGLAGAVMLPEDDPAELSALRAHAGSRPDLTALDLRVEAARREQAAASRWWAPDLRLELGWKGVAFEAGGRTDGFLAGASLSLPLWDQSDGLARAAEGEARAARGRRALLAGELQGELEGKRAEAVRVRDAAAEFREQTVAASSDLVRIAAAGYAGGELGVLELLDAYRGGAEDALTAIDMDHDARRARIELDRMTGARP